MATLLKSIQPIVGKYTSVLSEILKMDVEIVDQDMIRIAGTGLFASKVGMNIESEGHITKKVLDTGKTLAIFEPRIDTVCRNCKRKEFCNETFEMSAPIIENGKAIGVIGFACSTDAQRDHILANYDLFKRFLDHFSELIASKAVEENEREKTHFVLELLKNVINKIEEGVMIIDNRGSLIDMNEIAVKILKVKNGDAGNRILIKPTGAQLLEQDELELFIGDKRHIIAGKHYELEIKPIGIYSVTVFHDIDLLRNRIRALRDGSQIRGAEAILGNSPEIAQLKEEVRKIARSTSTVLISGESGTGKELCARAIHQESSRAGKPFVAINCAAIPDAILESELFGYVKGAFTGANPDGKSGKIEAAAQGTLFLDEIGDMPLSIQAKMLRVVEQKEVERLGSNKVMKIDIRIIAATNRDLEKMIDEFKFREDLYYRLNVLHIHMPPLRSIKEDIDVLTLHFVNHYSNLLSTHVACIDQQVWECMRNYSWPGNVRELENTVERLVSMMDPSGLITLKHLSSRILGRETSRGPSIINLKEMEKRCIALALKQYGKSAEAKKHAAQHLGIGLATLYRKMKQYNIS